MTVRYPRPLREGDRIGVTAPSSGVPADLMPRFELAVAGFFAGARAVLVGRTSAPDSPTLTQDAAVLDALGVLGVPIIADVECGHPPPRMQLVNGALGRLVMSADEAWLEQTLA